MTRVEMLDLAAVAERIKLKDSTIRGYHNRAAARRRAGTSRPGDFPPPDQVFGASPVWRPATIDRWLAHRPGRGTGGGPKKNT